MQLQQLVQLPPTEIQQFVALHETSLIEEMFATLGTSDSYMREAVTYQLFTFCVDQQLFSIDSKQMILQKIVDEQLLLQHISEKSDAVFTRSASALWLTQLVKHDDNNITEQLYDILVKQALESLKRERDCRGFVNDELGWADAVGVKADLCLALLQHPLFHERYTSLFLQAISNTLWNDEVFVNNEDERFIKIIMTLIAKQVDEALFIEWVEQLFDKLHYYSIEVGYTQSWFIARTNILQLMKTQYFHLKFSHQYDQLRAATSISIQNWLKLS